MNPAETFREAVLLCRRGKWHEGYDLLARVAPAVEKKGNLPGLYYSFLGLAMAHCEGRKKDGMKLCRYAVKVQPKEPDNHVNLAWMYLMIGNRRLAWRALDDSKRRNVSHERAAELHEVLGVRRPPLFKRLPRSHVLNVVPGRIAHWWRDLRTSWDEA